MKTISRLALEHDVTPFLKGFDGHVLDVGSKDNRWNKKIPERCKLTTLDIDTTRDVDVYADIAEYKSEYQYDHVLAVEMLEHTKNPLKAVNNIHELLKEGGTFIGTVPWMFPEHGDYQRWTPQGLQFLFLPFTDVCILPVGNFVMSSWQIFNFHNKFSILTPAVYWASSWYKGNHCPLNYLVIAKK